MSLNVTVHSLTFLYEIPAAGEIVLCVSFAMERVTVPGFEEAFSFSFSSDEQAQNKSAVRLVKSKKILCLLHNIQLKIEKTALDNPREIQYNKGCIFCKYAATAERIGI